MLDKASLTLKIIFSIPFLALINIIFSFIAIYSSFSIDKSKFPITCDLENFQLVLFGGYQSLGVIVSDTTVALRFAELGIPNFLSTPIIPLFFALIWIFKVINSDNGLIWFVNAFLGILTAVAFCIGFFSNTSMWLDTEKAKLNIWGKYRFIQEVKWDAIRIRKQLLPNNSPKTACNIALEIYTASTMGYCQNSDFYSCFNTLIANPSKYNEVEEKTAEWIYGK